jgi:hypothetical protein
MPYVPLVLARVPLKKIRRLQSVSAPNLFPALQCKHTHRQFNLALSAVDKSPNFYFREGRAALVTSFGVFKYLGCASFVQFITVLLLYWIDANLTDFEFLFCDLLLIATLSITCKWNNLSIINQSLKVF